MPGLKHRWMDQTRRQINRRLRIEVCCVVKINNHYAPDDKKFNTVDVIMRDRVAKADEYRFRKQVVVPPNYLGGHCMGATRSPRVGDVVLVLFYGDREAYIMGPAWSWAEYPVCRPTPYDIADKGGQWMEPFQDQWGDFPRQPYPEIKKPYCFRWFHGPVTGSTGKGRDWAWLFDYCHMGDETPSCKDCKDIDCITRCSNHGMKFYSSETESKVSHPLRGEYFAPCGSYWMFESKCCEDCENCTEEHCCSELYTEGKGFWTIQGAKAIDDLRGHLRHSPTGTMEMHSATPVAAEENNVGHRAKVYSPEDTTADQHGLIAAELINLEKKALVRIYKDGSIRIRASTDVTGDIGKSEVYLGIDGHCWLWNLVDDTYIEFPDGGGCDIKDDVHILGNLQIDGFCTHGGCSCESKFVKADGVSGGQTLCGGTGASDKLTLKSTSNASETGKAEITSCGAIEQSDSTGLKRYNRYRVTWPSDVCDGTYGGYILLGEAYTSGKVANSLVMGRITLSRGSVSSGERADVYDVLSKSAYQSETLIVNVPLSKNTFFLKTCKITYGGVAYHAIKVSSSGGSADNGMYFDGYATKTPVVIRSDSGSSETDFGSNGFSVNSSGKAVFGGDLYVENNCSALSFTDRTPIFTGDALDVIDSIYANERGEIDHASLPEFAIMPYQDEKGEWWPGRSVGDMVSVLTTAMQQMIALMGEKDGQIADLVKRLEALEARGS